METIKWIIDPAHSDVRFSIRHLVSKVSGYFKDFMASMETKEDDFTTAQIEFRARANSITTHNDQRDQHLLSKDFFDAEKYPEIIFRSNRMEKKTDDSYTLTGILTLHGISKPVTLQVAYGGLSKDPWGNFRSGFTVTGKINRKDFGINFNMLTEAGGLLLGDEVAIECNAEFIKQSADTSTEHKDKKEQLVA